MGFATLLGRRIPWPWLRAWRAVRRVGFRTAGALVGPWVRRPFDPTRVSRILVIRDDRIGDAILSTPFLASLKENFPSARIAVLASLANADVFRRLADVDEVAVGRNQIAGKSFDLAIDLYSYAHIRTALAALRSGARQRVGHDTDGRGFLFTVPVPFDPRIEYEAERSLDLMRGLGLAASCGPLRFPVTAEERADAEGFLARAGAPKGMPIVAVHPGSGERYSESRRVATWKLARIGDRLQREWGFRVLVTGGAGERALADDLASRMIEKPIVATGETRLGVTAALLERASFVLVGDTGILHLARAVGAPVVAMLGPTGDVNGPARLLPAEGNHVIVRHDLGCARCNLLRCPTFACLQALTVEEILDGCRTMMERLGARKGAA